MKTFAGNKNRSIDAHDGRSDRLGEHLRKSGKLTESDIDQIIVAQREGNLRFGEAAIGLNLLSVDDIQMALAQQYRYPYVLTQGSNGNSALYASTDPFGEQSEAIRRIRSQLLFRCFNDKRGALAVISCRRGEGASSVAANLAISFAQLGERTLLIDADFRRPVQQQLFGLPSAPGLSHLLNARCTLSEVLSPVPPFESLSVLCAGSLPPNPLELLSQISFAYLIETAPANFDVVIVDTPPILDFADAQFVAARAGACLLSMRRNETRLPDLVRVKELIAPTGANFVGAVLAQ